MDLICGSRRRRLGSCRRMRSFTRDHDRRPAVVSSVKTVENTRGSWTVSQKQNLVCLRAKSDQQPLGASFTFLFLTFLRNLVQRDWLRTQINRGGVARHVRGMLALLIHEELLSSPPLAALTVASSPLVGLSLARYPPSGPFMTTISSHRNLPP